MTTLLRSIPMLAVYLYRMVVDPTVPNMITFVLASRTPSSSIVVTSSRLLDSSFCSRMTLCTLISPVASGRRCLKSVRAKGSRTMTRIMTSAFAITDAIHLPVFFISDTSGYCQHGEHGHHCICDQEIQYRDHAYKHKNLCGKGNTVSSFLSVFIMVRSEWFSHGQFTSFRWLYHSVRSFCISSMQPLSSLYIGAMARKSFLISLTILSEKAHFQSGS